jgi:hypothetical protein
MTALRPDITPLPDLLHGRSRSGPVRERRPVYVDLLPPCNAGCPAGENIQAWLAHVQAGEHELAWRALVADNPFAAIHGRVCYHPCESVCNRDDLDSAVSIHAVERFLGDLTLERGWLFDPPPVSSGPDPTAEMAAPTPRSSLSRLLHSGSTNIAAPPTSALPCAEKRAFADDRFHPDHPDGPATARRHCDRSNPAAGGARALQDRPLGAFGRDPQLANSRFALDRDGRPHRSSWFRVSARYSSSPASTVLTPVRMARHGPSSAQRNSSARRRTNSQSASSSRTCFSSPASVSPVSAETAPPTRKRKRP